MSIKDLASRAIAAWQAWKEYDRAVDRERRHLLHDTQEAL